MFSALNSLARKNADPLGPHKYNNFSIMKPTNRFVWESKMHLVCETLDDVLLKLYPQLLAAPLASGATRGTNREILGTSIHIAKPRARLSRTETRGRPFSAL